MTRISVCICTRRRPEGIRKLLESFLRMDIPPDLDVGFVIIENDTVNTSQKTVEEFAASGQLKISYFLEPTPGLVFARNRSVKESVNADFCCFTDDDEIVSKNWLTELFRCQREYDADGVAGPTYPLLGDSVKGYIRKFHQPKLYPYGTIISNAYTGNLLLRKKYLDLAEGPFDERLNLTGGEDIHLTYRITALGGVIRYNPGAEAFEGFSGDRTTVRYILRRVFRNSNTGLTVRYILSPKGFKRKALPRLTGRFFYGLLTCLPLYIIGGEKKLNGLIKVVNAAGGFWFIAGKKNRFYK